ncbi:MAG: TetR/AcrR family transcriptional regulator C-terminal domain-containing protein, partial [Ktedonobacterales bacterium]
MKSSPEHVDLRVRRTHKLLWEALMAELAERTFAEITVKDICERAMVHRTTFYAHYVDKYALLEQGMRQILDALVAGDAHAPPCAFTEQHPPDYFVRLFEHAAHHQRFYRAMVCGEGIGRFERLLKQYIAETASGAMRESPQGAQRPSLPAIMHAHYVAGATLSLLAWWLENDMP